MHTRKLGLALDMDTIRAMTTVQLQCARTATIRIIRTPAHLTVTTVQIGFTAVSLLVPGRGTAAAIMDAGSMVAVAIMDAGSMAAAASDAALMVAVASDADRLAAVGSAAEVA